MQKLTRHIDPHDARSLLGRHLLLHMIIVIMLTFGIMATTTACGTKPGQEDRMGQSGSTGVTADQAVIDEALGFGAIALPPSAIVLGVQYDKGIDQRYRLAIGIDPDSVETLLSGSGFTAPLEPDPGPFMAPIDGFDLKTATNVSSISDTLVPQSKRTSTVFRRVAVDRSDPAEPVVHVWLFTT